MNDESGTVKHPNADPEYRLSQLLDGDLPPNETSALRADLARDADLRDAHEAYARVDALVRAAADSLPDVDWPAFAATVSSAIDADLQLRNDRRTRRWQFAGVAAAAAAVAMFVLLRPAPLPEGPGPGLLVPGVRVTFADGNPMPVPSAAHPSGVTVEFFAAATPPSPPPTRRAVLIVTIGGAPPVGESGPEPASDDML